MHVGIRGPLYSRNDIKNDESFGFKIIHCDEFQTEGTNKIAERIRKRVGDNPLYLSIDIDVLDPAFCLLYTSPSPRDGLLSRMPSSA